MRERIIKTRKVACPRFEDTTTRLVVPIDSKGLVISILNPNRQDCSSPRDNMNNGTNDQHAKTVVNISKKLQDDLQELGQKIKHHEENINFLKSLKSKMEESILDMHITMGKHHTTNFSKMEIGETTQADTEEETIQHILKYEKSAAALLLKMKTEAQDHLFSKDVVGLVATLGKVEDANLSRILSEYLGLETMLAVVCKSYEGVSNLEAYTNDGLINKGSGIHAFAASIGWPLHDRFRVICLEDLRPFPGKLVADDPQRRLDLLKPRLVNGQNPTGFLGFAVNMILIDHSNLYSVSNNGHSLRETLFYNLFSNLQVYQSREDMLNARSLITGGAISLDGGVMRGRAVFSLGHHGGNTEVKFPSDSQRLNLPDSYFEVENRLKEAQWKKDRTLEEIQREQELLDHVRYKYEAKKRDFVRFLAESSTYATQHPVGRASTPR